MAPSFAIELPIKRQSFSFLQPWPKRLVTAAAWGGLAWLLGPLALKGLLISGLGGAMALQTFSDWQTKRCRQRLVKTLPRGTGTTVFPQVDRFHPLGYGYEELDLSLARLSKICQVHHDGAGSIRRIDLTTPRPESEITSRFRHEAETQTLTPQWSALGQ